VLALDKSNLNLKIICPKQNNLLDQKSLFNLWIDIRKIISVL